MSEKGKSVGYFTVSGETSHAGSVGGKNVAPAVQEAVVHAHQWSVVSCEDGILEPL